MKFEKVSFEVFEKSVGHEEQMYNDIKLPRRATENSAGYDFFLPCDIILYPNETCLVPTGIKCQLDTDKVLNIYPRSGLGFKYRIRLCNTVGIIDADYYNNENNEGHIMIKLVNEGISTLKLNRGEAFAQGVIHQYFITEDDNLTEKQVRAGGFGSTSEWE